MSKNPRITPKERGLLKGAIRRVFSRSELRREALATASIEHYDASRPRVKKWSKCQQCLELCPTYLMVVDHIDPIIPINQSFEEMSFDIVIDRAWCVKNNLAPICKTCHAIKTAVENRERRMYKKRKKK